MAESEVVMATIRLRSILISLVRRWVSASAGIIAGAHLLNQGEKVPMEKVFTIQCILFPLLLIAPVSHASTAADQRDLTLLARSMSAKLPVQLDATTRLETLSVTNRGLIQTLTLSHTRRDLSNLDFEAKVRPILKQQFCGSQDLAEFRQRGFSMSYSYRSSDGAMMPVITLKPSECNATAAPNNPSNQATASPPAVKPAKELPVGATDGSEYVRSLGYFDAVEYHRGENYTLFKAYLEEKHLPKVQPNGYHYPGASYWVMVHYVETTTPVVGLEHTGDMVHSYSQAYTDRLLKPIVAEFGKTPPGEFHIYHYVHGYESLAQHPESYHQRAGIQAPVVDTFAGHRLIDRERVYYFKDVIGAMAVDSALSHCVNYYSEKGVSGPALTEKCDGHVEEDNQLPGYGYVSAVELVSNDSYSVYQATLPGSKYATRDRGRTVFVIIHHVGPAEPFFGVEPVPDSPGFQQFDREFMDKLQSSPEFVAFLKKSRRVNVHHHVSSFEMPWNGYMNVKQPVLHMIAEYHDNTGVIPSLALRYFETTSNVPPRTARESLIFANANRDAPRVSDDEKATIVEQTRKESAERYGQAYRSKDFWDKLAGRDHQRELKWIHDGKLDYHPPGPVLRAHYRHFMQQFGNKCSVYLRPDFKKIPVTTTNTPVDLYENPVGPSTESTKFVNLDEEYAARFVEFTNLPETTDLRLLNSETYSKTWEFFDAVGCDSPSMNQLRINLLRRANGEPSIQAMRQNHNGVNYSGPVQTAKLQYADTLTVDDMRIVEVYENTPKSWLPPAPKTYLASVRKRYGERMAGNAGGYYPVLATVEAADPYAKSLAAMRITSVYGENTKLLARIRRDLDSGKWKPDVRDAKTLVVTCEYRDAPTIMFWMETPPVAFSRANLAAINSSHPLLQIRPPQQHCPQQVN